MKRLVSILLTGLVICLSFGFTANLLAQVGIGTNAPNNKAALEIQDNTRGFLPPRMTTAQRTTLGSTLATADEGMLVYDVGVDSLYVWRGTAWRALGDINTWRTIGNSGTNPSTNFIGTTDNQALAFRTNNQERARLTAAGQLRNTGTGAGFVVQSGIDSSIVRADSMTVDQKLIVRPNGRVSIGSTVPSLAQLDVEGETRMGDLVLNAHQTGTEQTDLDFYTFGNVPYRGRTRTASDRVWILSARGNNYPIPAETNNFTFVQWNGAGFFNRLTLGANGSVATNSAAPNPRAGFWINDAAKGFLPPRGSTTERNTLGSTLLGTDEGMMYYDSTVDSIYVWRGTAWRALASTAPAGGGVGNGTLANQTLRWDGGSWTPSSLILNDALRVGIDAINTSARFNVQHLLSTGTAIGYGLTMTTASNSALISGGTWNVSATNTAQSSQVRGITINASNEATVGSPSVRGLDVTASGASNGNKFAYQGVVTGGGAQIGTLLDLTAGTGATSQKGVQVSMTTSGLNINQTGFEANLNNVSTGTKIGVSSTVTGVTGTGTAIALDAILSGNTTTSAWALRTTGGGIIMNPNLINGNPRPNLSTSVLPGEIRGSSNGGSASNDGFLRLSAGGGTSTAQQSGIDLAGGNSNADLNNTIVLYTAGTERMRVNATGNIGIANAPSTAATLSVGNVGSGNVPLLLGGATQGLSFTANAFNSGMIYNAYFDGSQYRNIQSGFTGGLILEASTGDQVFSTGSNGGAANAAVFLGERLRIERSTGAILPGNTFGNQNIGSSTRPWNEVYAKKIISLNAATSLSTLNTGGLSLNSESVVFPSAFLVQSTNNNAVSPNDAGQSFTSPVNTLLTRIDITHGGILSGVTFTLYAGTNYSGQVLHTTTINLINGVTSVEIPYVQLTAGATYCWRIQTATFFNLRISFGPPDAYTGGHLLSGPSAAINTDWDAVFSLIGSPPTGLTIASNNNVGVGTPNPQSNFHLSGGLQLGLTNVSANYTIGARDVMVNLSNSGPITVTFPTLTAAEAGRTIFLIKSGPTATVTFANASGITSLSNSATGRMAVWLGSGWFVTTLN